MKLIRKQAANDAHRVARGKGFDRRTFLKRSGLTAGGTALAAAMPLSMMKRVDAQQPPEGNSGPVEVKRTVCSHCSVGCGSKATVQNGVWIGQEPDFDSPFNMGGHCAKGAALRSHGHSTKRIKYPMKLEGGQWKRLSWDQAIDEIGDKFMQIREESGPDAVWHCGSSKASNEGAYLQRKYAAFWGTNNIDHQARICHSTTVAGVANTWGYGAMTNSYNDMHNCKSMIFIGSNAAEAHPVAMQHVLRGKENGSKLVVVDPRLTRTAAHADQHIRIRPGTDIPFVWGLLWHIFENGWEDNEYIRTRVYAMDEIRREVANWTPAKVEDVTGVPEAEMYQCAKTLADNRPGTIVWCMGGTQHHVGNANTRAYCVLQLALGNIGKVGGGANIFRGHDNVQGATDVGPNCHSLPGYYGLAEAAWKHWARVWDVDFDWIKARFDDGQYADNAGNPTHPMNIPGIPVSRWIDGILEDKENLSQRDNIRAVFFQGHAVNSQVRGPEMKKAVEKLDLVVISDPYPTHLAVMSERTDGVYLLPTATQFEQSGSCTASNRSLQWREKVIDPLYESKTDAQILYLLASKFGFADEMFKNISVSADGMPSPEDTLREINRGVWTVGYTGQSPERLKLHLENKHTFNTTTLQAQGGPCDGDTYGLPWPCWGTAEVKHPGSHVLYNPDLPVSKGGLPFRARFGSEHNGNNILAEDSWSKDSEIQDGHPPVTFGMLRAMGWHNELTPDEMATIAWIAGLADKPNGSVSEADVAEFRTMESDALDGVGWHIDLSGGIQRICLKHEVAPFGNAKARAIVWTFPDPVPIHREPLYTPRYDLVDQYPTHEDMKSLWRLPTRYASIQADDFSQDYPLVFTSGRLVEYEGGGEETRSMSWLAELQQEMFVEINPIDANDRGLRDNDWVWLEGPEGGRIKIRAMVTERVGRGVVWTPFHFGGWFQGEDLVDRYPEGTAPYIRGESCNTATTYGYDPITLMQETKSTLCQIQKAA
ncbi:MAG: formate dehydrogenase subunit alpha [Wenzhouxiangella sp.]